METFKGESLAHLRHELRTPVNHILGYSELLIEDAEARHLAAFIPVFQQIRNGGRQLLESIQTTLAEKAGTVQELNLDAFKENLRGTAAEVLETSTALLKDLQNGHRQTLADLDAISWALLRLIEFSGQENGELARKPSTPIRRIDPVSRGGLFDPEQEAGREDPHRR